MDNSTLTGANLMFDGTEEPHALGLRRGAHSFRAFDRAAGSTLGPDFAVADLADVEVACAGAASAFLPFSRTTAGRRAEFLSEIANQIEELGDVLIERAAAESGLPVARLTGERARTCGQLRMFANLIQEGSWVEARIEHSDPSRTPPKPDLRRMLVPLGPVAVFGASNFPLAFSVAGGDTASALAAGCPVVVKAHPAHPGTSEYVAGTIIAAAAATKMPSGVFSMLHGGADVGQALVLRPEIYAVGFTGSLGAGRALFNAAAARPRPIPVFAEMGSVNPVFLLPGALRERGESIAKGYADSLTLGVGQFCTNPGVVVGVAGEEFDHFLTAAASALAAVAPGLMLTEDICARYQGSVNSRAGKLTQVFCGQPVERRATPALFATTGEEFLNSPELAEEVFGPAGLAVACQNEREMAQVARALEGQLTTTVQMSDEDTAAAASLLPTLERIAGRVVFNGFPTGVEVNSAMQHGGPYPATTDPRSTSVGTAAILRFARPVAFQNTPPDLLPPELQDANPLGIWRLVDGALSRD
jgi:NADP-dependent aldehyde dehydrogenase